MNFFLTSIAIQKERFGRPEICGKQMQRRSMSINLRFHNRFQTRKYSSGMTMIEVAFAMIILAIVAGAIFGTVRATMETTYVLTQHQNRQEEISGFIDLCRRTFQTLPPSASLEGVVDEKSAGTFRK